MTPQLRCRAIANIQRAVQEQCPRPAKGTKRMAVSYSSPSIQMDDLPACGVHLRQKYMVDAYRPHRPSSRPVATEIVR